MWNFEVLEHGKEGGQVWVLGKLTINTNKGEIIKTQFGRADIKIWKGTKNPLDYGNDLKAAATDSLKKCASELGIASDIYGQEEFKEIQGVDRGFVPPKNGGSQDKLVGKKLVELKGMLKGKTDSEKIEDLKKRTGIQLQNFKITEKHAGVLVASLLNVEVKK